MCQFRTELLSVACTSPLFLFLVKATGNLPVSGCSATWGPEMRMMYHIALSRLQVTCSVGGNSVFVKPLRFSFLVFITSLQWNEIQKNFSIYLHMWTLNSSINSPIITICSYSLQNNANPFPSAYQCLFPSWCSTDISQISHSFIWNYKRTRKSNQHNKYSDSSLSRSIMFVCTVKAPSLFYKDSCVFGVPHMLVPDWISMFHLCYTLPIFKVDQACKPNQWFTSWRNTLNICLSWWME